MSTVPAATVQLDSVYEKGVVIQPRLPFINGIFDLGPNTLIASHAPHEHIREHLHDHLPHLHIRYGFEIPRQPLLGVNETALVVIMMIKVEHRVDCNPVFVALGPHNEGVCLRIADQDVHWVHNEDAAKKGTIHYESTGRRVPQGFYFAGFSTADTGERKIHRYTRESLLRAIGAGLRADQHFQATWRDPKEEPIEPYPVTIGLSDDTSPFFTFFELRPTVALGPS